MLAAKAPHALTGIFNGLAGFSRVAIAVSGGADSTALLRLAAHWQELPHGPQSVFALTVDHGLRTESADEALKVAKWCEALKIEHHVLKWQGEKPSTGIQAKARTARYDAMSQWCRDHNVQVLMTAHTADDQAETVAMRQKRTDSDRSLAAIWPENEWRGVKLFRPLLRERRDTLRAYLKELQQDWLEDPSNVNANFERVRVRADLAGQDIAELQQVAHVAQDRVREADSVLQRWRQLFCVVDDYAVLRFSRQEFAAASVTLKTDIMAWALCSVGDGQMPERAVAQSLCQWVTGGNENRRSANGAIVSARRHVVEVMREPARMSTRYLPVEGTGIVVFDGRFLVKAPAGSFVGVIGVPPQLKRPKDVPALAFSAAPLVKLPDGTLVSAVKSGLTTISATLCEQFLL